MTIKWFKIIKTTYITIIKGFFSILLHGLYGVQFSCIDNKININYIFELRKS